MKANKEAQEAKDKADKEASKAASKAGTGGCEEGSKARRSGCKAGHQEGSGPGEAWECTAHCSCVHRRCTWRYCPAARGCGCRGRVQ